MAPTRITRSVARENGVPLQSLDAGVHKPFKCIICNKGYGSRAVLSRHFESHTTRPKLLSPFTHPSCWDDTPVTSYPSGRYTRYRFSSKGKLRRKKEPTPPSLLHWWFRVNEESLRARMEFGPEGLFPRKGEPKLEDHGQAIWRFGITAKKDSLLEHAQPPPISQLEPLSPATTPTTQAHQLVSNPDASSSASAETGFFDHNFDRSLNGSVIADFELASTRPLTSVPLLWCMSNTITHYVQIHGEDCFCALDLKDAAERFLDQIEASQDLVDELKSHFNPTRLVDRYMGDEQVDREHLWVALHVNEKCFRKDRAFIWDLLEAATMDYFGEFDDRELPVAPRAKDGSDDLKVIVWLTWKFVKNLDDAQTSAYIKKYWNGEI